MANKRIHELTGDSTPDADAYLVLDKSTYAAPVKATVTQLLQGLPVAPQTAGGNARGTGAVDLQVARNTDAQVASGQYAAICGGSSGTASGYAALVGGGEGNIASGNLATVPGGGGCVASGYCSQAAGLSAFADKHGQHAQSSFSFAAAGDAQRSSFSAGYVTTDATPTELLLDYDTSILSIADDTAWLFRADVIGITGDAAGYGGYTVTGIVRRSNGTVTVHGVTTVTVAESAAGWDATATADNTNKALSIVVTGAAGTTIRWHAAIYTSEITYA